MSKNLRLDIVQKYYSSSYIEGPEGNPGECEIEVVVRTRQGKSWKISDQFSAGQSFGFPSKCMLDQYLDINDDPQLFISTEMGAVRTYLLGFMKGKIKVFYKMEEGRIHSSPCFDSKGQFIIQERWPLNGFHSVFGPHSRPQDFLVLKNIVLHNVRVAVGLHPPKKPHNQAVHLAKR